MHCEVCDQENFKYKCPKCDLRYCSLSCWKIHKEQPCQNKCTEEVLGAPSETNYYTTDDSVPSEKLELLRDSKQLFLLLQNPHLKKLLVELDTAEKAWEAIQAAMMEPLFLEFADEVLKIVDPVISNVNQ